MTLYLLGITFVVSMQSPANIFHVSLGGVDTNVFHYVAAVMAKGGAMYRDTFDHKGPLLYFINYLGLKISYYSGAWLLKFVLLFVWVVFSLAVLVQAFLTDDMKTIPRFLGFFLLGFCIVLAPIFLYLSVKGIIPGFIQTYFLFNFEYSGDAGAKASIWTAIRFMAHEWMFPSLVAAFLWAVQEKGKGNIYWKAMVVFPYPVAAHVCHERKQLSILSHLNDPLLRGTAGEGSGYRVLPSALPIRFSFWWSRWRQSSRRTGIRRFSRRQASCTTPPGKSTSAMNITARFSSSLRSEPPRRRTSSSMATRIRSISTATASLPRNIRSSIPSF